jgi:endogenous inhibitor of DNA gyrase (YacG/DUF329 family)
MPCPICRKLVDDAERDKPQSAYPFCGERCKLIDLGRWLDGAYQVPVADDENPVNGPDSPETPE